MPQALLRFAVIADSHVNPSDADLISPYESHRLTNSRLEHTVRVLNALGPAFVMHVGDMVHPVPEAVSYPQAVARFRRAIEGLAMPLHAVAGNHDIGDKLADYVPAGSIRPEYLSLYCEHFGPDYYSFDAAGCHFTVINTSLINSGLPQEAGQRAWLEQDLAANAGRRIFLFMHYPPFIATPAEHGHYDNIDEPGRSDLLDLLQRHAVAAAFTGHVHNFFFNRHGATPIFSLPSTAFVRSDYTEMFSIGQPPAHENGRNDSAKLGVLVVDVYADRVVPQFIRTFDQMGSADARSAQRDWPLLPPAAGPMRALGIDLRHGWTELHSIPYSSMLDEFRRKQARNDYPVMALWEMGIRRLRVPLDDLLDAMARERMAALAALGARFTVFSFGWPDAASLAVIAAHRELLAAVEVILKWPLPADVDERLARLRATCGVALHVSRFWSASGQSRDGKQIKLLVDHGFSAVSGDALADSACVDPALADPALADLAAAVRAGAVDALVFRVASSVPAHAGIAAAVQAAAALGARAQVHVRLASDSPAEGRNDPLINGHRVLEAALCAHTEPAADVFIDTLADVDRGYFPRAGLVDRRFNPHPAGRALRNLHGVLSTRRLRQPIEWQEHDEMHAGIARDEHGAIALVLPAGNAVAMPAWPDGLRASVRWDLATATRHQPGEQDWDAPVTAPTVFELAPC